jgi:uncharacterized OB-fold protein
VSETEDLERTEESRETREDDERLTHREWAEALEGGTLMGQECQECGHVTGAPKAACAQCGSRAIETTELDTEGEVYTVTTIGVPPAGFEGEYQVALIDLGAGRVLARIDGSVEIGEEVRFAEAIEADGHPAPVFEPTTET